MANKEKATLEAEFKHGTSIGEHGQTLYDCPIEINNKADLDNFGITWDDCRFLHFNGSQHMRVYFFRTENRELAEEQWAYIDTVHSSGFASMRCMVPGRKKPFIKCPTTNSCARCPYGRKPEEKQSPVISLDGLLEDGYEPGRIRRAPGLEENRVRRDPCPDGRRRSQDRVGVRGERTVRGDSAGDR